MMLTEFELIDLENQLNYLDDCIDDRRRIVSMPTRPAARAIQNVRALIEEIRETRAAIARPAATVAEILRAAAVELERKAAKCTR